VRVVTVVVSHLIIYRDLVLTSPIPTFNKQYYGILISGVCMYGIPNCGFKKDELNMYFSAYDNFSCFFTDSPVSVYVCMYCFKTIHPHGLYHCLAIYILFDPHIHYIYPCIHIIRPTRDIIRPMQDIIQPMHTLYTPTRYID